MMISKVQQSFIAGESHIVLNKDDPDPGCNLIAYRMLRFPWRNWVVNKVKEPLVSSLILAYKLLKGKVGEPTKLNTINPHARILIDEREWFMSMESNEGEREKFRAVWDLIIYLVEHDLFYRFRFNRILARLVDKVNSGEWKFEPRKPSDDLCWNEFKDSEL